MIQDADDWIVNDIFVILVTEPRGLDTAGHTDRVYSLKQRDK